MPENTEPTTPAAAAAPQRPTGESQKERWFKYGANVVIATVVVILLAGIVVYLAQKTGKRIDTTESRAYSLKPQTLAILNDVKGKTKLVSLYREEVPSKGQMKKSPYADVVADLLDEYRRHSSKIDVEVIDPVKNNAKVESLIGEVASKYGGEVQKYKKVTDAYAKTYDQIKQIAAQETAKAAKLPVDQLPNDEESQLVGTAVLESQRIARELTSSQEDIQRLLTDKPPNYKGAVDEIKDKMDWISDNSKQILEIFKGAKDNPKVPPPIRQYVATTQPYTEIRKLADELTAQTKDLGELKLDDLRTSLKAKDTILVIGENDMRVIPADQVWKSDDRDVRGLAPGQEIKPRFAGEQQVSTAILALNQQKKQKVVFVRNGGPPMAQQGQLFGARGGPFSAVAQRLRDYNFDVMEKDLTGMWAMQAQMQQQMPPPPEPTDEQIKDAIWIVLNFPTGQQNPKAPTPSI
jgi:hypothetical protein